MTEQVTGGGVVSEHPLRDALADALYADTWTTPKPEWGEDWHHRFPRWMADHGARIVLATLVEHRDEVLAALGIRRFGWVDNFAEVHSDRTHGQCEPDPPCALVYAAAPGGGVVSEHPDAPAPTPGDGEGVPCSEFIDIGPFRFECDGHLPGYERQALKYRDGRVTHHAISPQDVGDVDVIFWTVLPTEVGDDE